MFFKCINAFPGVYIPEFDVRIPGTGTEQSTLEKDYIFNSIIMSSEYPETGFCTQLSHLNSLILTGCDKSILVFFWKEQVSDYIAVDFHRFCAFPFLPVVELYIVITSHYNCLVIEGYHCTSLFQSLIFYHFVFF